VFAKTITHSYCYNYQNIISVFIIKTSSNPFSLQTPHIASLPVSIKICQYKFLTDTHIDVWRRHQHRKHSYVDFTEYVLFYSFFSFFAFFFSLFFRFFLILLKEQNNGMVTRMYMLYGNTFNRSNNSNDI